MVSKSRLKVSKPTDTCYISVGCNRTPGAVDWSDSGLICYGACNSVAVYDPKDGGGGRVITTLTSHKARVNGVRWIRSDRPHEQCELVSVSSDKTAVVWTLVEGEFQPTATLSGHSNVVTVADALYKTKNLDVKYPSAIIATTSVDSTVKLWERQDSDATFTCTSTIDLRNGICLSLSLVRFGDNVLLACANDDCKIHIYSANEKLLTLVGHEDWVRSVDFTSEDNGDILLASGSQDSTVRMWRFSSKSTPTSDTLGFKQEEQSFLLTGVKWIITLESVLCGHEGWVYSVQWCPQILTERGWTQPPLLLSSSLDRTIVVWTPEEESGVWLEHMRVGELGGNTLGYYGARFGPCGKFILGHSFQGAFHLWIKSEDMWRPGVTVSGHFDGVEDISWEPEGRYLLSVSLDQTTRLHAPWSNNPANSSHEFSSWHEMCRPQIHGHDLSSIAVLSKFSFVSASEEKISRVFTAPQNVLQNLQTLINLKVDESILQEREVIACGAAVPALGLSNKAVFVEDTHISEDKPRHPNDEYAEVSFSPQILSEPGSEDYLVQNSLWPETMKLYGHGYEVFSLASTHSGKLVASACKATTAEHARIMLWDTEKWEKVQELEGHQLTVTQMCFSPDDTHLLSVSRDRRWCLFGKNDDGVYSLVAATDKSTGLHTRIIWTCSWSHDSKAFATGSREGRVVVWGRTQTESMGYGPLSEPLVVKDSVTALAFAPAFLLEDSRYLLAMGGEKGWIQCYSWCSNEDPWRLCYQVEQNFCHHLTVKRLVFRPVLGRAGVQDEDKANLVQLASCSSDCSVRVHNIDPSKFF